jgi:hypothetical protein
MVDTRSGAGRWRPSRGPRFFGLVAAAALAVLANLRPASARAVVVDAGARQGFGVRLASTQPSARRRHRPRRRRRRFAIRRSPAPIALPPGAVPIGDRACLARLGGVPFVPVGAVRGIETPVEITGPIGGVSLIPRGGRPPLMDCELASALAEAAPLMRGLGISGLSFSGTYEYRTVRGTDRLSGHAFGLAIDVHGLETRMGPLEVERDYPRDPARWRGTPSEAIAACIGGPASLQGQLLRTLACELRSDPAFHLVITPDDNYDHRNHLHLEAYPSRSLYSATPAPAHIGRRVRPHW